MKPLSKRKSYLLMQHKFPAYETQCHHQDVCHFFARRTVSVINPSLISGIDGAAVFVFARFSHVNHFFVFPNSCQDNELQLISMQTH